MTFDWDKYAECPQTGRHKDGERCNADRAEMIAEAKRLEAERDQLRERVKVLTEALEWVVEQNPDLYGHENPEKGMPLTPVAAALSEESKGSVETGEEGT